MRGFTESLTEIGYQGIRRGDLVIHAMDAFAGAAGVSDSDGKGTSVYSVCVPRMDDVDVQYYAHCVREMARSHWILALSRGIRERSTDFRYSVFGAQIVPLPPPSEQSAIVRFLDHADRRIRRYIRAKEKLIALLEEQKQAIIHQAVTGRVDVRTGQPHPAYKPSGVEWLGDVPVQWKVLPLCAVARPKSIVDQQHRELLSIYLNRGVIRFAEVEQKRTNVTSEDLSKYQAVDPGDFVLNNQQAWRGSVGVSFLSGIVSPAYLVLSLNSKLHTPYANVLFRERVMVTQYLLCSRGVGSIQRNLYWPHLKRVTLPCPPNSEQIAIVRFLDETASKVEKSVTRARREIDLLHEFRTRLIADVVTGKLDVRAAAAALPEDTDGEDASEGDCAEPEGGDEGRTDHGRRTEFPAAQEEMIA